MKLRSNKKSLFIGVLILFGQVQASVSFDTIVQQYQTALQDFVQAFVQLDPSKPLSFDSGNMVGSTYLKILRPYLVYMQGYGSVINHELICNMPYGKDLQQLQKLFLEYQKKIVTIAQVFPKNQQQDAIDIFYQQLTSVVDTCCKIIKDICDRSILQPQDLASCYLAYQVAYGAYVKGMKLTNIASNMDFHTVLLNQMIPVYQAAIVQRLTELKTGQMQSNSVSDVYAQIQAYHTILAAIYSNAGDNAQQASQQQKVSDIKQQALAYTQATQLQDKAERQVAQGSVPLKLDILDVTTANTIFKKNKKYLDDAFELYQQATAQYKAAQYFANQISLDDAIVMLQDIEMVAGAMQELWLVYVQDQSPQGVFTAPSIATFISTLNAGQISAANVGQCFLNLYQMITQPSNAVNALATGTVNEFSLQVIVDLLKANILSHTYVIQQNKNQITLATVESIKIIIFYLTYLAQGMSSLGASFSTENVAMVMSYADALDQQYTDSVRMSLQSWIPYFPDQLKKDATFKQWIAQILVSASVVSSVQDAYGQVGKATIEKPILPAAQINIAQTQAQAAQAAAKADQLLQQGNFVQADQAYEQAFVAYQNLYQAEAAKADTANVSIAYKKALEIKTLLDAASFVSMIKKSGNASWANFKNIATSYVADKYPFTNIDCSDFGSPVLPASLQVISAEVSMTTLNAEQQKDCIALIKAYLVKQLLSVQSIEFTKCFYDYTLKPIEGVHPQLQTFVNQVIAQVDNAMNNFSNCAVVYLQLADAKTIHTVEVSNISISVITPLCVGLTTVVNYLDSAYSLLLSGTAPIQVAGMQYVPGNRPAAANIVNSLLIDAYVSQAYVHYLKASQAMQEVLKIIASSKKLPENFITTFGQVNSDIIRTQTLLYASDYSAYEYAQKNSDPAKLVQVKELFFGLYSEFIDWMKQCLALQDAASVEYMLLMEKINDAYTSWQSMLDPKKDIAQIQKMNQDVITLCMNAVNSCLNTTYQQAMFPGVTLYHYAKAETYLTLAKSKYNLDPALMSQVQEIEQRILKIYFLSALQNLQIYMSVKQNGLTYLSDSKQITSIKLNQLHDQYIRGFSDSAEMAAYNKVTNLLFDAAMNYIYLKNNISNAAQLTAVVTSSAATVKQAKKSVKMMGKPVVKKAIPIVKADIKKSANLEIMNFLKSNEIPLLDGAVIAYYTPGAIEKIMGIALTGYTKFQDDNHKLLLWINIMLSCVQTLYAQDYLGVYGEQTDQQQARYMEEFFQAMQKDLSAMQNPAAAYVG